MNRQLEKKEYLNSKITKFIGVGLMNTIVGYAIYALLVFAKIPYFAALLMATVAGVTFNYFSIGKLVFKSGGGLVIYYKFIAAYVIIYLINVIGLILAIKFFKSSPYFGQALCVPPSAVLSWLLMNYWVFKK